MKLPRILLNGIILSVAMWALWANPIMTHIPPLPIFIFYFFLFTYMLWKIKLNIKNMAIVVGIAETVTILYTYFFSSQNILAYDIFSFESLMFAMFVLTHFILLSLTLTIILSWLYDLRTYSFKITNSR